MVLQVGDKVIVYNAGTDHATAVKIDPVQVGDKVDVITLSDGSKIPLPRLELDLSDYVWCIPEWDPGMDIGGGDFGYGVLPLGAALFTLSEVRCLECSDDQREWVVNSLVNMNLILVTGGWKGVSIPIRGNTETSYSVDLSEVGIVTWDKGRVLLQQSGTGDNAGNLGNGEFDYSLTGGAGWVSAALNLLGITTYKYGFAMFFRVESWYPPSIQSTCMFNVWWMVQAFSRPDLSSANYTGINIICNAWSSGGWYEYSSSPGGLPNLTEWGFRLVVGRGPIKDLGITLSEFIENRAFECPNPACSMYIRSTDSYEQAYAKNMYREYAPGNCPVCGTPLVPHWAIVVNTNWPEQNFQEITIANPSWMSDCRLVETIAFGSHTPTEQRQTMGYLRQTIAFSDACLGCAVGDKYFVYDPVTKRIQFNDSTKTVLSSAYWRAVGTPGEEVAISAVEYAWDGQGYVYLSASKTVFSTIYFDDEIRIDGTAAGTTKTIGYHAGERVSYGGETVSRELVNITAALRAGNNSVVITVKDTGGAKIGFPTAVYIKRSMTAVSL